MLETRWQDVHPEAPVVHRDVVEHVSRQLLDAPTAARVVETFKVLGDATRVRIVHALSLAELCTSDLAALLGISEPTASHHLRTLRQMRLVRFRRQGRLVYYALDDEHIRRLVDDSLKHVTEP
jgi:DNA-binding transcriptional ArsR family regulator